MAEEQTTQAEGQPAAAEEQTPEQVRDAALAALGDDTPPPTEPEPPAEAEAAEPPEQEKTADDLAREVFRDRKIVTKQKRALAKRQREAEAREAELTRREGVVQQHEELDALLKQDPYAYLERTGVDMRTLAERMLSGEQNPLEAKVLELEKRLAERDETEKKQQENERIRSAQRSAQEAQKTISQQFEATAEQYPELAEYAGIVIDATGESASEAEFIAQSAWQHLLQHYEQTGEELPLDMVFRSMAGWAAERLPAVRARFERAPEAKRTTAPKAGAQQAAPQPAPAAPNANQPQSQTPVRTLTNSDAATRISDSGPPLTREELRAEALKVLNS